MADATGDAIVATDAAPIESVSSLAKPGEGLEKPAQYIGKQIPATVKQSVLELVSTFLGHNMIARREYVKKCVRNHELFRGNGWGWYDYATGSYRRDFSTQSTGRAGPEQASFVQSLYQLNIFQPFTLSVISLLSSNKMTVKFWPENSRKPQDVEASRKHDLVYRAFARSERHHSQLVKAIYHLWCDGTFGSYIRSVYDADRFGWVDEPVVEHVPQEIGPPSWKCVVCQTPSQEPGQCQNPECGAPLPTEPNVPPPMATLPKITGYEKTPRGKTVRDIVPGLEMVLPPTADDMWEYPYLGRRRVVAKSTIRAAYSEMAKQIGGQSDADMGDSANETLERRAQMQLALGTNVDNRSLPAHQMDHLFYTEFWLRRSAFFQLDDEKRRDELLDLFPDGCYVAFADALVLEVRSEKMDDHWRVCHGLPGPGQIREPIGGSLVQIQEIVNDLVNMIRDTIEFTMPMTFADADVVDLRQMVRAANAAGMMIPVTRKAGRPVSEAFYQTQPGQIQPFAVTFLNDLRTTWAQFATGAFPAAYGGGTPGNATAMGIEIERNSALGRISLFLRALTEHWLSCAPLVIKDFRENGMEPLTIVDKAPAGDYSTDTVSPEDLEIGNAKTMPELNEEYPVTWPQRQAALLQMFTNPLYQSMLAMISNAGEIKRTLGHDLRIPGEDAYEFQSKLIKKLLEQAPVAGPDIPVIDPMTGQPAIDQMGQPMMQPGPMIASIMPQQIEDHPSMLQACIDFYYSDEASQYRDQPGNTGWQNFMLHAGARQQAALEQMQTMPPAQPNVPEIPVPTSTAQPPQATPMMPPGPQMSPGLPAGGPPQMPPAGPPAMMGQALPPGGPLPM